MSRPRSTTATRSNSPSPGGRGLVKLAAFFFCSPRRVAVLGLGTGITAGGAAFHPVEKITVVELVPEVIAAARDNLAKANAGVLDDTRTRVIVEDARCPSRDSDQIRCHSGRPGRALAPGRECVVHSRALHGGRPGADARGDFSANGCRCSNSPSRSCAFCCVPFCPCFRALMYGMAIFHRTNQR